MSTGGIETRLVAAGMQPHDAAAKQPLFDAALDAVARCAPAAPSRSWWVPGRLEVFGKHTDYAGGNTIVAAVPRGFAFAAAPVAGDVVMVVDARHQQDVTIGRDSTTFTGWRHYVHVVVRRLAHNFPEAWRGAAIAFASDLPRASGMSSSSALVVGVATALTALWELRARADWQRELRTPEDEATYFACLENGSAFGALEGDSGVGTQGGSEDHAAIMLGRAGVLSSWSFLPMRRLRDVRLPDDWTFVVASSGVPSEKTGRARDAYNRLSLDARALLALWNRVGPPAPSLAAALRSQEGAAARLREFVLAADETRTLAPRLDHFILEDALIPEAIQAFERADRSALGALSASSHEAAERLLRNQIAETNALVRLARTSGALAASGFGAGFGGSVWAVVERARAREFAASWLRAYLEEFPHRTSAEAFGAAPGPPLTPIM